MSSIHLKKGRGYCVAFRWNGRQFTRSCETTSVRDARGVQARIDDTIKLLKTGRLVAPEGVPIGDWIFSGGTLNIHAVQDGTLAEACEGYLADVRKAANTRDGEQKHVNHLQKVIGKKTRLASIDLRTLKRYRDKRRKMPNRYGGTVGDSTIKKEMLTFSQIWTWGRQNGMVSGECPLKDRHNPRKWALTLDKPAEREPFRTWHEIEAKIEREKTPEDQQGKLYRWVYLDEDQVADLLKYVEKHACHRSIYVAFVLAACAGMRRSEILESLVEDVRLDDHVLVVREKKRKKNQSNSTRKVPIKPGSLLEKVLRDWLSNHPGGTYLIVDEHREPWSNDMAADFFKRTLRHSKWSVLPGYHCLRHSFGSICLRLGIPTHMTAKWMGHTTDEMVRLYQKSFPKDEEDCMSKFPI